MSSQDHLTIRQVADEFQCSQDSVRRMIARGELRAYRLGKSRVIRIDRASIEKAKRPVTRIDEFLGGDAA